MGYFTYAVNVAFLQFCQVAVLCGKAGQASVGGQLKGLLNFGNEECNCIAVGGAVASWLSIPASSGVLLGSRVAVVTRISAGTVRTNLAACL